MDLKKEEEIKRIAKEYPKLTDQNEKIKLRFPNLKQPAIFPVSLNILVIL
jgi:hypothetical protein